MANELPTGHIWVTNVGEPDAVDAVLRTYRNADKDYDFVTGPPQRTYKFTQEQLMRLGVTGIYGKHRG